MFTIQENAIYNFIFLNVGSGNNNRFREFGLFYLFVIILRNKNNHVPIAPKYYRPNRRMVRKIFSIGIPSSLSMVIMSFLFVIYNTIALSYENYVIAISGIAVKAQLAATIKRTARKARNRTDTRRRSHRSVWDRQE
jgi:hypothetical protein